jgi:F420-non-reducing hydrogenase small subunit
MTENGKPKLAIYWASSCGGCEISILNIHENLLTVDSVFDLAFFPCAADFKVSDVRSYPDGYIDVCLFNGAIRNSENAEMARLLREKSQFLVAYGSCATEGCIPALANLTTKKAIFNTVYLDNPSLDNQSGTLPQTTTKVAEGELELPQFSETVKALDQVVDVDYYLPGCPPEPPQIWAVLQVVVAALLEGAELPPRGTVVGAKNVAVCQECPLEKDIKKVERFYRPFEIIPEPGICLFEQGLICMGMATRGGCGALCPQVGIGCRGCYGPLDEVPDVGSRMISAVASVIDLGKPGDDELELEKKLEEVIATIPDPAGTFYRFSMAHSLLHQVKPVELRESSTSNGKGAGI